MKKVLFYIFFLGICLFSCTSIYKVYHDEEYNKTLMILKKPEILNDTLEFKEYNYVKQKDLLYEINFLKNSNYRLYKINKSNYSKIKHVSFIFKLYKLNDTIDIVSFIYKKRINDSTFHLNNIDINNPMYYKLRRPKVDKYFRFGIDG